MSTTTALIGGALIGSVAGAFMVPFTRRELAASLTRAADADGASATTSAMPTTTMSVPRITKGQWLALVAASGLLPAYVLHKVGWSIIALPPLLLLVGLVQLAYCDLTRRLLPKTLVWAMTATVILTEIIIAGIMHEWQRLLVATVGGLVFFALFFVINLINPSWIAFGDVRLSLGVGFGLAWVSPVALLEGFLYANLLAVFVRLALIAVHRAERKSGVPFGLYLAFGAAFALVTWS